MPELFLHYIWLRKAFMPYLQHTTFGQPVEVINTGIYNTDAGPDFSAATIRIGGMMWTGNVEMHVRASDWYRHHHDKDKSYDNVILHVVAVADKQVFNSRGEAIAQCELQFSHTDEQLHRFLTHRREMCSATLSNNHELLTDNWKQALLSDRMRRKAEDIKLLLAMTNNSWEDSFYITLAHNFGFHTNGLPFEMVAKQTPLTFLRKHRQSLFQLEAMLLGQSGLLPKLGNLPQREQLMHEYEFLQRKFSLAGIDPQMWKYLRMRPQNFPEVRLRQFAALIHKNESLFSHFVIDSTGGTLKMLREKFDIKNDAETDIPAIGKSSQDILLINSVVPYMYAYGESINDKNLIERSFELLADIPAEKNHVTEDWKTYGFSISNAADSQTFLHLTEQYCCQDRCYDCEIGYHIFSIRN